MREGKFIVILLVLRIKAESDERETISTRFGHDDETELLEGQGEVVGCAGEICHDGTVAVFAQADELVVLSNDLGGTLGEVKGKGGLVGAEIVDVED